MAYNNCAVLEMTEADLDRLIPSESPRNGSDTNSTSLSQTSPPETEWPGDSITAIPKPWLTAGEG